MLVESVALDRVQTRNWISTLASLEVGQSIYVSDARQAESVRVSSYYLVKSRNLPWKFVSRKMDKGWRVIRVA
jgi:hypothetical protein